MTNKITHAPADVIAELDGITEPIALPSTLLEWVYDQNDEELSRTHNWLYGSDGQEHRELAVVLHFMNIERLQPERVPRWYVETTDLDGVTVYVRMGDTIPTTVNYSGVPDYKNGMTEKQAKGYAGLFGGGAKEIK